MTNVISPNTDLGRDDKKSAPMNQMNKMALVPHYVGHKFWN